MTVNELSNLYFWRQNFILFTVLIANISGGISLAFPAVLNAAILAPNTTDIRTTAEEASWITASQGIAAIPAFIILPLIMERFGRRAYNLVYNMVKFIGWITLIFAKNTTTLIFGRIFHGVCYGATIVSLILIAEYAHPKRRGYFLAAKKVAVCLGILTCHCLHLCWDWRHISMFAATLNLISTAMTCFWPESPTYLAMRNRLDDCEKSFLWLHGPESSNKDELTDMIALQEETLKDKRTKKTSKSYIKRFIKKDFLVAVFISVLTGTLIEASGRHTFAAYLLQMMLELLGDKSAAVYVTIGNDVLSLAGLSIAVIIVRHFNRRTLLLSFGALSIVLMFVISAILFCKSSYPLASLDWWSAFTILLFSFVTNIGVVPIAYAVIGEVFPTDLRGVGVSIAGMMLAVILGITLKVTPTLLQYAGLGGTFLLNACVTGMCLSILYFILPETKDRTLVDIEFEMKGKKRTCMETSETRPMLGSPSVLQGTISLVSASRIK